MVIRERVDVIRVGRKDLPLVFTVTDVVLGRIVGLINASPPPSSVSSKN